MARVVVALVVVIAARPGSAQSFPFKMSVAGDSLSQAALADGIIPADQPWNSWAQGINPAVNSIFLRYRASYNPFMLVQPVSRDGAQMIPDFATQAGQICGQFIKPNRVFVLLGQNDACHSAPSPTADAAAFMPSVDAFVAGLQAGLSQLAACLPGGSLVQVVSVIRVDFLLEAGIAKNAFYCPAVWQALDICRIITAEPDPARRAQVGQRIDAWNAALAQEVALYNANARGENPRFIRFVTDWEGSIAEGKQDTSAGTHQFGPNDLNGLDCFHPSIGAHHKLACLEWAKSPDGSGSAPLCLQ